MDSTVQALFDKFDLDKSGTLSNEDLLPFFCDLAAARPDLALNTEDPTSYDAWFKNIDKDGSGTVDTEDLKTYLASVNFTA